jgi:hypothetical protein
VVGALYENWDLRKRDSRNVTQHYGTSLRNSTRRLRKFSTSITQPFVCTLQITKIARRFYASAKARCLCLRECKRHFTQVESNTSSFTRICPCVYAAWAPTDSVARYARFPQKNLHNFCPTHSTRPCPAATLSGAGFWVAVCLARLQHSRSGRRQGTAACRQDAALHAPANP